jgi:transaldolase
MRIFLATAKVDDLRGAAEAGLADGVLTTPILLAAEGAEGDGRDLLADISRAATVPVCVAVAAVSGGDMYREGREIAKLGDHLIVQLPLVEDAPGALHRLAAEGVRVAASLVFSPAQALLAAKAGASMISTSVEQLEANGYGGLEVLSELRGVLDAQSVECDLMAAHPRNAAQFGACALAGADASAVDVATLRSLILHPLTDRGIDQYLSELSKRPKVRVPS